MAKKVSKKLKVCDCANSRHSSRRDVIVEVLSSGNNHLSAEEIYVAAKKKIPGIGIATVYRALKCLCGCGKVLELILSDGVSRYETADRAHHDHLICTSCGIFIEAMDPKIERLQEKLAAKHGFKISSHHMKIFGLCSRCSKKK